MKKLGLALLSVLFLNSCQVGCNLSILHMKDADDVKKVFNDEKYDVEVITNDENFFDNKLAYYLSQGTLTQENIESLKSQQKGAVEEVSVSSSTESASVYIFSSMKIAEDLFKLLDGKLSHWSCYYANTYCYGSEDLVKSYFEQIQK